MKKVLIISYAFYDTRAIGSIRIIGLTKYLPYFNYEPIVLTSDLENKWDAPKNLKVISSYALNSNNSNLNKTKSKKKHFENEDIKNLFKKTKILSYFSNLFLDFIYYPDNYKVWQKTALRKANELLKSESFDIILSSFTPPSCHIIANQLKKDFNIPWIADFRDLWTQSHYYNHTKIRKMLEERLELDIIANADALITTTKPFAEKLRKFHKKKTYFILNGFEEKDFNKKYENQNKFLIVYTGSLYKKKRDPSLFFEAVKDLIYEGKIDQKKISIKFFGPYYHWLNEIIKSYGLEEIAYQFGLIQRDTALGWQTKSQILLLLLWDHPEEKNIPGKLFDYFSAQRPILAIARQDSEINSIIDKTNTGLCSYNKQKIKDFIKKKYNEWQENGCSFYDPHRSELKKYTHKEMAKNFSYVFDQIIRR